MLKNRFNSKSTIFFTVLAISCLAIFSIANCGKTAPSVNGWQELSAMPTARASATGCVFDDGNGSKIFVAGGSNVLGSNNNISTVEIYDFQNNRWTITTPLPEIYDVLNCTYANGKIYLVGLGSGSSPSFEAFYTQSATWENLSLPFPWMAGQSIAAVNGHIYFIGGFSLSNGDSPIGSVEVYYPATGTWEALTNMPTPRATPNLAVVGTDIYAIGGVVQINPQICSRVVERYSTLSNTWVELDSYKYSRTQDTSAAAINYMIYFFGGVEGLSPLSFIKTVEAYNIGAGLYPSWENTSIPPVNWASTVVSCNGKIYCFGGANANSLQIVGSAFVYIPTTN